MNETYRSLCVDAPPVPQLDEHGHTAEHERKARNQRQRAAREVRGSNLHASELSEYMHMYTYVCVM